jgi:hypothetical protein
MEASPGGFRTIPEYDVQVDHEAVRFVFRLYDIPGSKQKGLYDKICLYARLLKEHYATGN